MADFEFFVDRVPESRNARLHYKLCEVLGRETGHALGSPGARQILNGGLGSNWLFDRGTGMVLPIYTQHPLLAALLYTMHTGGDMPRGISECSDKYIMDSMGFWQSSVASRGHVMCNRGISLTAQEKMAFRGYHFRSDVAC